MSESIQQDTVCAFHYNQSSDGVCAQCKLPICSQDQYYNKMQERICPICNNVEKAKPILRYIQFGLLGVLMITTILLFQYLGWSYALLALLVAFIFPYFLRPVAFWLYFKNLQPTEVILPLFRYFEALGNIQQYNLALKYIRKLSPRELEDSRNAILDFAIPAIMFNYSRLPRDWEENLVEHLKMSIDEFEQLLITKYRNLIIKTAVHNTQADVSKFIFRLGEKEGTNEFLTKYIQEIAKVSSEDLDDDQLNTIYKGLLEELFLYEEEFYSLCDKLGLNEEKEAIRKLVSRYVPPPVPKSKIEALIPSMQQINQQRQKLEEKVESSKDEEIEFEQSSQQDE